MPPGSVPCANADCLSGETIATGVQRTQLPTQAYNSTGRIDPPYWFGSYGWQGLHRPGQLRGVG